MATKDPRLAVSIRPLCAADRSTWGSLWKLYLAFYKTELDESIYDLTFQRLLDPAESMHGAFAEIDGKPVGLVHFIEHRTCWSPKNSYYLQDLYVEVGVRGRGIGRALIEHVYEEAKKNGVGKVHWLTHETNKDAQQLYDKIGEKSGFIQYRKNF